MILDGHTHLTSEEGKPQELLDNLKIAGLDGAVVLSLPPSSLRKLFPTLPPTERLDHLFYWTDTSQTLYPFYFLDPTDDDAMDQIHLAVDRGVMGFKVMCDHYYPAEPKAVEAFGEIAAAGKPILFHSGILFDGKDSSNYNRPGNFEALLEIKDLKFALAHISWPWCDECLAVYGKFESALEQRKDLSVEMFIDTTPGTPPIYRRDALTKLFTIDYELKDNVFFGTDNKTNDYNCDYARELILRDNEICDSLNLDEQTRKKAYSENLLRFLGVA